MGIADDLSVTTCINDATEGVGGKSFMSSISASPLNTGIGPVPPGVYLIFIKNLDPTKIVLVATYAASGGLSGLTDAPTSGSPKSVALFPGSSVERLRVTADRPYVFPRLLDTGSADIYLVPLVQL